MNYKFDTDKFSPAFLRIGLSIVFLYFGISQLINPEAFIGWLPPEVSMIPLSARTFVVLNGGFELFAGTLMLIGIYRRTAALLLGLHLAGITFTIGLTDIGVRDLGLTIATLAITLVKNDAYTLDAYLFSKVDSTSGKPEEQHQEYNNYQQIK